MTFVLLAHTMIGGGMMLALFYVDRLGAATWLMLAAGVGMIYTSMGCLTRDVPRFKLALQIASATFIAAALALVLTSLATRRLEGQLISRARTPGAVVYVSTDDAEGGQLATLWLAWKVCLAACLTHAVLAIYLPLRIAAVRRATRPD